MRGKFKHKFYRSSRLADYFPQIMRTGINEYSSLQLRDRSSFSWRFFSHYPKFSIDVIAKLFSTIDHIQRSLLETLFPKTGYLLIPPIDKFPLSICPFFVMALWHIWGSFWRNLASLHWTHYE